MTIVNDNYQAVAKCIADITGAGTSIDGCIEVVIDYTSSVYFDNLELPDLYEFVQEKSAGGHEVHFGPALRKDNLGSRRSARDNIHLAKSFWVDIDSPDKTLGPDEKLHAAKSLTEAFIEKLQGSNIMPSYIICSGHGFHLYFVLQNPIVPDEKWSKVQNKLIQFGQADRQAKDSVRLMRVPGTFNYKDKENPKPVHIVGSSGRFYALADFDPLFREDEVQEKEKPNALQLNAPGGIIPPCIQHLLDPNTRVQKGHRHLARLVLSTFAYHEGWPVEDAVEKVKHFTEDPKKSEDDVRGVYKVLDEDPSKYTVGCGEGSNLKALVDAGVTVCNKDACQFGKQPENKPEEQEILSGHFDGLVDLVLDDQGKVAYLVLDHGNVIVESKHKTLEGVLVPPPRDQLRWELAKANEVIKHFGQDNDSRLFEDLVGYHRSISELPSDNHYRFLAVYVMHTYLRDKGEYSPMVWFYAIPERGKTRTGKGIIYVAYRGVHMITLNEAHILRMARDHRATIFFDITDIQQAAVAANVRDVLLNRYESGATIPRVHYPERGPYRDTVYYDVYGPTIVATNETVDDILATRSIQIVMPQSARIFDDDIKPIVGLPFRERLLAFRARWMHRELPSAEKPCAARLGDILRPIRQIVRIACSDESWFLNFVKHMEQQRKSIGSDSLEAQVVNAIKESLSTISHGHIVHEDIMVRLNQNRSERENISPQKLGRITASLGFKKYSSGQQRGIYYDETLMIRLCERYGTEFNTNVI